MLYFIVYSILCSLVQDDSGNPFTDAAKWTKFIQAIFKEHTGRHIGPTTLRSSFITYLMDGEVTTDEQTLRSVAHAMRHTTRYVSNFEVKLESVFLV